MGHELDLVEVQQHQTENRYLTHELKIKTHKSAGWNELHDWMEQLSVKMKGIENEEEINKEKLDKLLQWLLAKQGMV